MNRHQFILHGSIDQLSVTSAVRVQHSGGKRGEGLWLLFRSIWCTLSREAVLHFFGDVDVFVSLPTDSGKSLCYYMLPGVFGKVGMLKQC